MSKTVLMAAAAAFALTAGGAMAAAPSIGAHSGKIAPSIHTLKGAKMLYNQNSNSNGEGIVSQNFSTTDSIYDAAGADDFVVPSGKTWKVKQVDVTGLYFNGSGPATSENVIFYKNKGGMPGAIKKEVDNLSGTGSGGVFSIPLGTKVKLKPGTYWVSVVANMNFPGFGEWGWEENGTIHGNPAMWQNPGGGFGVCPTWGTVGSCIGFTGDFMFDLQGKG